MDKNMLWNYNLFPGFSLFLIDYLKNEFNFGDLMVIYN